MACPEPGEPGSARRFRRIPAGARRISDVKARAAVSSFPEKSISVSGKGFVRSVWYPDVLEILTRGTRATGRTGGEALEQQHVWIAFGGARASMRRWRFS